MSKKLSPASVSPPGLPWTHGHRAPGHGWLVLAAVFYVGPALAVPAFVLKWLLGLCHIDWGLWATVAIVPAAGAILAVPWSYSEVLVHVGGIRIRRSIAWLPVWTQHFALDAVAEPWWDLSVDEPYEGVRLHAPDGRASLCIGPSGNARAPRIVENLNAAIAAARAAQP